MSIGAVTVYKRNKETGRLDILCIILYSKSGGGLSRPPGTGCATPPLQGRPSYRKNTGSEGRRWF